MITNIVIYQEPQTKLRNIWTAPYWRLQSDFRRKGKCSDCKISQIPPTTPRNLGKKHNSISGENAHNLVKKHLDYNRTFTELAKFRFLPKMKGLKPKPKAAFNFDWRKMRKT